MNAVAQKPKEITKAASKSLASEHRVKKTALQPVAAAAELEFARGRDIALSMLAEADTLGDEREAWRRTRSGRMQDNFFKGYIADIIEEPALMDGFAAVLSATLRNDHMDLSELAGLTLAETKEGVVGEDGTIADSDDTVVAIAPAAIVADVAVKVAANQLDKGRDINVDNLSDELIALNGLLDWVIQARDLCDDIRISAQIDPQLHAALKMNDIRFRSAEWRSLDVGSGLAYVLSRQHSLINSITGASK